MTPFSQWMIYRLEQKFPVCNPEGIAGDSVFILVLGGGHSIAPELPPSDQISRLTKSRLIEGIRLYRRIPGSKIVSSGTSVSDRLTQAEMVALSAIELGVSPADTLQIRSPKDTAEEIRSYKDRFGKSGTLVLVTSAYHMPRAMFICKEHDLNVIAAPTDFYLKKDPQRNLFDFRLSTQKIQMLERALREYAGIVKVKWID